MPDGDYQITISAETSELTSALKEARNAAEQTGESLKESIEGGENVGGS